MLTALPFAAIAVVYVNLGVRFSGDPADVLLILGSTNLWTLLTGFARVGLVGAAIGLALTLPDLLYDATLNGVTRAWIRRIALGTVLISVLLLPLYVPIAITLILVVRRSQLVHRTNAPTQPRSILDIAYAGQPIDGKLASTWAKAREAIFVLNQHDRERTLLECIGEYNLRVAEISDAERPELDDIVFRLVAGILSAYAFYWLITPFSLGPEVRVDLRNEDSVVGYAFERDFDGAVIATSHSPARVLVRERNQIEAVVTCRSDSSWLFGTLAAAVTDRADPKRADCSSERIADLNVERLAERRVTSIQKARLPTISSASGSESQKSS